MPFYPSQQHFSTVTLVFPLLASTLIGQTLLEAIWLQGHAKMMSNYQNYWCASPMKALSVPDNIVGLSSMKIIYIYEALLLFILGKGENVPLRWLMIWEWLLVFTWRPWDHFWLYLIWYRDQTWSLCNTRFGPTNH